MKDTIGMLKEMANAFGYELKRKEVQREGWKPKKELKDKLEKMNSELLMKELKIAESNVEKLSNSRSRLKDALVDFLNDQGPNVATKTVFDGNKFLVNKLSIKDQELTDATHMKDFIESKLNEAIEDELIKKFEAKNPDLKGKLSSLRVELGPTGNVLVARGKAEQMKEEKVEEKKPVKKDEQQQ